MVWFTIPLLVLISFLVTRVFLTMIAEMLLGAGFVRPNFRGQEIPLGLGLVFFIAAVVTVVLGKVFSLINTEVYTFLFALGAMGFFGLVDDVFGNRHASGLKGHFMKLIMERELTTGALKALAGGFISLAVSFEITPGTGISSWAWVLINAIIIALSTNALNLLDLRPGRTGKGFLFMAAIIGAAGISGPGVLFLAIITGSLMAYLPLDLKAEAMMGDTGSNMLGITLGYTAVLVLPEFWKVAFFLVLVGFHLYTEKYSLTKLIERNKVLNFIDMLGRR